VQGLLVGMLCKRIARYVAQKRDLDATLIHPRIHGVSIMNVGTLLQFAALRQLIGWGTCEVPNQRR
jgi:hypothetical protein